MGGSIGASGNPTPVDHTKITSTVNYSPLTVPNRVDSVKLGLQ